MQRALRSFRIAIDRVRELGGLFAAIERLTTSAVDPTDLLRSQVVLSISALDHFVHEITVAGMLEIYDGLRPATPAYSKFAVPAGALSLGTPAQLHRTSFEAVIREKHGYLSFQRPDKIADAIRLFYPLPLWVEVAKSIGGDAASIKARMMLAVDRRNKIAHEADMDPTYPGVRWPITPRDATAVADLVGTVGRAIYHVCK